jgi:hypothetical protein
MTEKLSDLAAELTRVEAAIHDAPLLARPGDPNSSFSPEFVELVAREEEIVDQMIQRAREVTAT